jgi:hypothetical protein
VLVLFLFLFLFATTRTITRSLYHAFRAQLATLNIPKPIVLLPCTPISLPSKRWRAQVAEDVKMISSACEF